MMQPYDFPMRGRKQFSIIALTALTFFSMGVMLPPTADARPPRRKKRRQRATTGKLVLYCFVKGAEVEIDGKPVAKTPILQPIELEPGDHRVRVHKRGHYEVEEIITITRGQESEFEADLIVYVGEVRITSNVKGATVAVGGKLVGTTPFDKDIPAGKVELTVQANGYLPYRKKVNIRVGQKHHFDVILTTIPMIGSSASSDSITNKWWFWTIIGVVVAGGTAAGVVLGVNKEGPKNAPFSTDLHLK